MKSLLVNVVGLIIVSLSGSFAFAPSKIRRANGMKNGNGNGAAVAEDLLLRLMAPADSDFEKPIPVKDPDANSAVDENKYNVDAEAAADIWTVSVSPDDRLDRVAGVPFLDSKSKNHFVDDVRVIVRRDGGMGIELLELAGGRDDDFGLTIVSGVSGNAEKAGIIAGDSITSVEVKKVTTSSGGSNESREMFDCECKNFDTTIGLLGSFPPEIDSIVLNLKRIRRWPKINVVVEYPPIQCAEGVSNTETVELFAGENLKRALQNRGIIFEDRDAEKLMKNNPKCRLSCKTVVGFNMQEGDIRLRINLNEWTADDKKSESRNPFFSK
ncbi:hypothetical protein FRACYDRAFT_237635 [Fragilariopsis cylindrus CCMP1102]|uniref:PDZ domain-containing protein n=1 Tax=Fragilariopsis cylindrus CCMP1102 TaxID=635003 RepID=A0A1E7FGC7_9STRA|nr:hypothetical protein FRACYDRAFT_237635 [Fragilariopsis cylindrus CCMP1102]|eukprot:OEU17222.1 hypothetical protein FRACYDRAFT_237635 [Fragilariopsis cylindrus CCMP1102]